MKIEVSAFTRALMAVAAGKPIPLEVADELNIPDDIRAELNVEGDGEAEKI